MRRGLHRRWELSVEALLDGELGPARSTAAHGHVRACPDCAAHAVALLAVRAALRRRVRALAPLSPALAPRLEQVLGRSPERP